MQQARARHPGFIGQQHDDKHVFIHDDVAVIVHPIKRLLVQNVAGDGDGWFGGECAGLNQRVFCPHDGILQPVFGVVVHLARIELHDAAFVFAAGPRTQVHNAAGDAVLLHDFFNAMNALRCGVIFQRGVFHKQVIRGLCSVQHFVLIHVQLLKCGGCEFVFQLINDMILPHDAQQVGYGI